MKPEYSLATKLSDILWAIDYGCHSLWLIFVKSYHTKL